MNIRIVKYAINKKVFPPMTADIPKFVIGNTLVNRQGWKYNQKQELKDSDEYAGIAGPEKPE